MDKLKNAEFDVIFAHIADFCPIGLIHIVKPKSWAWLNGGPLLDHMATFMGLSLPASYAPRKFVQFNHCKIHSHLEL